MSREPRFRFRVGDASQPIGVFGHYESLTIEFDKSIKDVSNIWVQDLLGDEAIDVRDQVKLSDNKLILAGALIDRIGTSAGDEGDISVPGFVLKLELKP